MLPTNRIEKPPKRVSKHTERGGGGVQREINTNVKKPMVRTHNLI